VTDRSPFRIASLCVREDKQLYHEHRRLLRSRRLERRLRLETSFLQYKLALIRKQRGETEVKLKNELREAKTAASRQSENNLTTHKYIMADSDSDDEADVQWVLTEAQRNGMGLASQSEETPAKPPSLPKSAPVPKRPTNGYLCFCAQMRPLVLNVVCKTAPLKQQEMQRVLSQVWKEMPNDLKKYYFHMYEKDKVRYKQQMAVYETNQQNEKEPNKAANASEAFSLPNYLHAIPRFLLRLVEEMLRRDKETDSIVIDREEVRSFATKLTDEDFQCLTAEELPKGIITPTLDDEE